MTRNALTSTSLALAALSGLAGCGLLGGVGRDDQGAGEGAIQERQAAYEARYTALVATACDAYPAAFDASYGACDRSPNDSTACQPPMRPQQRAMVARFATCGQWLELFQRARRFPLSERSSDSVWSELDAQHRLVDRFVDALAHTDALYLPPSGGASADVLAKWLATHDGAAACPRIGARQAALGSAGQFAFTRFYLDAGCAEQALPLARANLAHDHPEVRIQACTILGRFGDKRDAEALDVLARRDPFQREAESQSGRRTTIHPVRQSCAEAANKVLLR